MKKFYDRRAEIKALEEIYEISKSKGRFTYITGNRRVGKTQLIKHVFLKNSNTLYFFVGKKSEQVLLREFEDILDQKLGYRPHLESLESFLEFIFNLTKEKHFTVIFDEFQNFTHKCEGFFSSLQNLWDTYKEKSRINLFAIGSMYSMMEKIFSSKKEPLYGRATNKFYIKPFNLVTLSEILQDNQAYSTDKLLDLYALFGGYPKYYDFLEDLNLFHRKTSFIFRKLFLEAGAPLKHEGRDLLVEEFGTWHQTYFSILEVISQEKETSNQKVGARTALGENKISIYLNKLNEKYNQIRKEEPLPNYGGRKGRYLINNHVLNIWFKYIFSNQSFLEIEQYEYILEKFNESFNTYRGRVFENFVRDILKLNYDRYPYTQWGKYWSKDIELDVVGINTDTKSILIGECKLNSSQVESNTLTTLNKGEELYKKMFSGFNINKYLFLMDNKDVQLDGVKTVNEHNIKEYLN